MNNHRKVRMARTVCQPVGVALADRPSAARGTRAGFTLIEMLLVLALVAIVTALAWPMLQKPFANRRLYTAADVVQAGWCEARSDALQSGHTYAFRYMPDGDRFCVQPEIDPDTGAATDAGGLDGSMTPGSDELLQPVEMTLPEGVKFLGGETAGDASAMAEAAAATPSPGNWSEPILFYADGTTSDAHVWLGNEYGSSLEVTIRGMTGVVTKGEVTTTGESPP